MRTVYSNMLSSEWSPDLSFLVLCRDESEIRQVGQIKERGITNVVPLVPTSCLHFTTNDAIGVDDIGLLEPGDVVVTNPSRREIQVVYRISDVHHSVFLTNRCNSLCLMCSQPPTRHDDLWLVDEAINVIRHVPKSPQALGMTGGEPTLLGIRLRDVLESSFAHHPHTRVDLLTNGRRLGNPEFAEMLLSGLAPSVNWLVPLYGHADFLHDFVVQINGAFEQTIAGMLNLHEFKQAIQLRIVLIDPVLRILPDLCTYIARNLPFVREVALMGCEPIGFALANRAVCEIDLLTWHENLEESVTILRRVGVPCILMNTPLCTLPKSLWSNAQRSISDWKQVHVSECAECSVKSRCSGLFAWHENGWLPGAIRPIKEEVAI